MAVVDVSLRALPFRRPPGPRRPRPFELAVHRLEEALDRRSSALWELVSAHAPVYGDEGQQIDRQRRLRSDGARNLCTLLQTAVMNASADGFLGSPDHGRWKRLSIGILDVRAFGKRVPEERSLRRTERALRILKHLGLVTVREIHVKRREGFESLVAIKHLTEKFWQLLGLWKALRGERRRQQGEAGEAKKRALESQVGQAGPLVVHSRAPRAPAGTPPAVKPPDPGGTGPPVVPAAVAIEELKRKLRA